ncbi:hypothetical protein O181_022008 [Austropuccinia psidii MF-1]|uniref:deoxyribose-phosphate aldolase n=1 Tax=Austropuccinia psidii MF-1 TaxID=1389203 RepID=A0A9Q3CFZ9_9BASI|nr:hypothetical protein [Austropuccinia psidii MF-1]
MASRPNETRVIAFKQNPAAFIDHTNLKPSSLQSDIDRLCEEAIKFNFKSVCVHPCWIKRCKEKLKSSGVEICTVIGFPLGSNCCSTKAYEGKLAIEDGATEIDLVMNVGLFLSSQMDKANQTELLGSFKQDILKTVEILQNCALKVIIETSLLQADHISKVSQLLSDIPQVSFIKTSTGFNGQGATVENVRLIREVCQEKCDVKASGGIKTLNDCIALVEAGAGRIGTSSGVNIMEEWAACRNN